MEHFPTMNLGGALMEMQNKLIGAAAILLNEEGHVLVVKHSYGRNNWDLPGGKAEANESARETAEREVFEETGLTVKAEKFTGIYYDPQFDMHHFVFMASVTAGQAQPVPSSPEILECRFCPIGELPRPMSDFTYNRIIDAVQGSQELFHMIGPRQWLD
jgi:8-oxo-dGTP diphosphatase